MPFNISILRMPPENTNSVLVDNGVDAVIFDPWGSAKDLESLLRGRGLTLRSIYATHGHYDHLTIIPKIKIPWYLNHADLPLIKWSNPILFMHGFGTIDAKKNPPINIVPGEIEIIGLKCEVIHTPGHSAGSVCFYFPTEKTLISGDTLFRNTIGRMDLPGSSEPAMRKSIRNMRERDFPDDTLVIPGHGRTGKFSDLKKENNFLQSW